MFQTEVFEGLLDGVCVDQRFKKGKFGVLIMWLEILINVSLSMTVVVGSFQFSSAIADKLKLNSLIEMALVVILVSVVGYVGFLISWISYSLDSDLALIAFRMFLFSGLLYLFQRRKLNSEQRHLLFVCFFSTLVAVTAALCRGIADSSQGIQHSLAVRYWNSVDNKIPGMFAQALQHKQQLRPILLDGWQGSDRPPIATGLVRVLSPLSHSREPDFFVLVACSSVLIVAVVMLAEVLWDSRNAGIVVAISVFFAPGIFVNTIYTWPKIIAASLTIVAIALMIQLKNERESSEPYLPLACLAVVLSLLVHGSSVYVLPVFVLIAMFIPGIFLSLTKNLFFSSLMYLPWYGYQQYWDPPGNRLLYWHLAGELGGGDDSIIRTIILKYQNLSLSEILTNKYHNFEALFIRVDGNPAVSGYSDFLGQYRQLTSETVLGAIGLLGWLGLLVFVFVGFRLTSQKPRDFVVFLFLSSITFCLIEFGDSFSTRASLVVSPMAISIGLAVVGLGSITLFLGISPKWIFVFSIPNILVFGPLQSTAAAAGWNLQLWDVGTCALLGIGLSILTAYVVCLSNQEVSDLHGSSRFNSKSMALLEQKS